LLKSASMDASRSALVADVGGTHARFGLVNPQVEGEIAVQRTLFVKDFPTPVEAFDHYLADFQPDRRPRTAIVAVAGPPIDDIVKMTNGEWVISVAGMASRMGLDQLYVVNDVAAAGWGMLDLDPADLIQLGEKPLDRRTGRFVAIGAGTGLGVAAVTRDEEGHLTVADSEGGHVDFAPVSEAEDAILAALRKRFGRVSCERLLSGQGLVNIFDALTGSESGLAPEDITTRADAGDRDAERAIDHFCGMLGSFAGNLVLMHNARDGLFLDGGVLRAIAGRLVSGPFRQRFDSKGRFSPLLAEVPALLVRDPAIGLRGAAAALRDRLVVR